MTRFHQNIKDHNHSGNSVPDEISRDRMIALMADSPDEAAQTRRPRGHHVKVHRPGCTCQDTTDPETEQLMDVLREHADELRHEEEA